MISSISGFSSSQYSQPIANSENRVSQNNESPEKQNGGEITTVTTHCNKEHKHDQSCPHTVTTRPAEPGKRLDIRA